MTSRMSDLIAILLGAFVFGLLLSYFVIGPLLLGAPLP